MRGAYENEKSRSEKVSLKFESDPIHVAQFLPAEIRNNVHSFLMLLGVQRQPIEFIRRQLFSADPQVRH